MNEVAYDERRLRQWLAGTARGFSRRDFLALSAVAGAAAVLPGAAPAAAAAGPIVKPLPPELFTVFGTNAEMRWSAMRDQGFHVPIDRFFVRNHTSTPAIDAAAWRLEVFGAGLRGGPVTFSLDDLKRFPAETHSVAVECAGNGRSYYTSQQGQTVSGTAWKLGAAGVARWRGVRLGHVLRRAGLAPHAVDVQPAGLDPNYVTGGVDLGPVRRPLPIGKALDDVLLAYEMNGEPLPPDHGHPVRLVVPHWIGIASIKWVGRIEVSAEPLFSPWNTQFYRLFGPDFPAEGQPFDRQVVKSAFELDPGATFAAGVRTTLTGRSWSANGPIRQVEVSTDGGAHWRRARPVGPAGGAWQRWETDWRPAAGAHELLARATDVCGVRQPDVARYNTLGYLFDAVVRVPVTAA
ncbi:sulfite oxidase [Paractinoplanes durhamensis]|uniref:Sulfite oxidase n=1 Tax=Paractinoplanes durhamensis TaxID=113563 RepID=A0ABQ3YQG3_9ACTN|nr:sulfite oxidase [Actinoplanes durhamensis]GID99830.1 sulfite oxidase [Actinoplanes durhamensis]